MPEHTNTLTDIPNHAHRSQMKSIYKYVDTDYTTTSAQLTRNHCTTSNHYIRPNNASIS